MSYTNFLSSPQITRICVDMLAYLSTKSLLNIRYFFIRPRDAG